MVQDDGPGPKSGGAIPPSMGTTTPTLHVTDFPGCAATQRGRDGKHQEKHRTPMVTTVPRLPGTQAIGPRRRGDRDGQKSGRPPAPDSARPTLSGMPLAEGFVASGRALRLGGICKSVGNHARVLGSQAAARAEPLTSARCSGLGRQTVCVGSGRLAPSSGRGRDFAMSFADRAQGRCCLTAGRVLM